MSNVTSNVTESTLNMTYLVDFNNTTPAYSPVWRNKLWIVFKVALPATMMIMMISMGCNTSLREIWNHMKRPVGFAIGAAGQFIMLPLFAFIIAHAFTLQNEHALGLLIVSSCPGGALSNIFTYWAQGDVSLSVAMTTSATMFSFGTMPFNLWVYSRSWISSSAEVPYVNIVITLVSILVPVIVGMIIKWRNEKAAKFVTSIGSVVGSLGVLVVTAMYMVLYPDIYTSGWRVVIASALLPLIGFSTAYLAAFVCRQKPNVCRTIGIETGLQNVVIATAIVVLSYDDIQAGGVVLPTVLYCIASNVEGTLYCVAYRLIARRHEARMGVRVETESC